MRMARAAGGTGVAEGFLELAPAVYANDPMWIPERAAAVARLFGDASPWLRRAMSATFCVPGRARAAGFLHADAQVEGRSAAFFGYWENVGDLDAAAAVLSEVEQWASDRGATVLVGPINFSTATGYRLRLSVEPGGVTFVDEPYNPWFYPGQMEALGLSPWQRYVTQILDQDDLASLSERKSMAIARLESAGYRLQPLDGTLWPERIDELYELATQTFRGNPAYVPIERAEFVSGWGPALARRVSPEGSCVCLSPSGRLAGVCLTYPHYGPLAVQGAGARRVPTDRLSHRQHAPRLTSGQRSWVVKSVGTLPEHRRLGIADAMVARMATTACHSRVRSVFGALIREDNVSRRLAVGHQYERRYALYAKTLGTGGLQA